MVDTLQDNRVGPSELASSGDLEMAVNQQGDRTTRKAEFTTFQAVLEKL